MNVYLRDDVPNLVREGGVAGKEFARNLLRLSARAEQPGPSSSVGVCGRDKTVLVAVGEPCSFVCVAPAGS